jgi:hypothetical protein
MMMEEELRPEDKVFLRKLYRVKNTIASMIEQRGYHDPQDRLQVNDTFDEFALKYRQNQAN